MMIIRRFFSSSFIASLPAFAALLFACVMLGTAASGQAGPLEPSDVDAEAKWLAHIDFDSGKTTKVGLKIYRDWLSHGLAQRTLQGVRSAIGLDLLEDVREITFYSTRYKRFAAVVIIRAKVDRTRLLQILDNNATHEMQPYGKHELHTWMQKIEGHKSEISGCFYRPGTVVLSRKTRDLKTALDVLDGKRANLADSRSALLTPALSMNLARGENPANPPGTGTFAAAQNAVAASASINREASAGTVIEAAAVRLSEATDKDIRFISPIVRKCSAVSFDCGEDGGEVFIHMQLHAETAEIAACIRDVINGLRAMVKLERSSDSHLCKALDALQLAVEGTKLTIDWRMPGPETMQLIETEWKKQQRQK